MLDSCACIYLFMVTGNFFLEAFLYDVVLFACRTPFYLFPIHKCFYLENFFSIVVF
ncbi:hypothetical protein Sjap_020810 [Stephania japonica]|uniref:Uncharacterized protein n=1 Tax=Stephania japonica TaxID=461633 RepID=A0AAP0F2L5_9MAGN